MMAPDSFAQDATLADVGEFGVLDVLTPRFGQADDVLIGPGDDAAEVRVDGGRVVVSDRKSVV